MFHDSRVRHADCTTKWIILGLPTVRLRKRDPVVARVIGCSQQLLAMLKASFQS